MSPAQSLIVGTESSSSENFVQLDVGAGAWTALIVTILVLLGIDLYRHREAHVPSTREALLESAAWVACGLGFSVVIFFSYGSGAFGEYLSGYLTEKALSVDNVFVWSLLFTSLAIPVALQHRVLFWGIFGALALRAVFIFAGAALLEQFEILLVFFGAFLVYTGIRMIRHREDEGEGESLAGMKLLERVMPVSRELDGQKFFTKINGKRAATPLLAALVVVEATDLVFAIDSVPAILALSKEEFLIFSSNAFAILGLRAMYFLLADARQRFHYLNHALGGILIFVGLKMAFSRWFHLNVWISLGTIALLLLGAVVFSEMKNRQIEAAAAER
ncbi:MAG: TerC family protein [Acidimicrobiales bacterium]